MLCGTLEAAHAGRPPTPRKDARLPRLLPHLLTITVGLLIALGLEGCVEWRNHRHLASEAGFALSHEIVQNRKTLDSLHQPIADQQKQLDADLAALAVMRANPTAKNQSLGFGFAMHTFDNVAWKTAQTTGALAYMPYAEASTYADIYTGQEQLVQTEQQVVDDVLRASALPSTQSANWKPTVAQIDELTDRIGMLRMRLALLSSMLDSLDRTYSKYESTHPDTAG
jgi:hypothetical protein